MPRRPRQELQIALRGLRVYECWRLRSGEFAKEEEIVKDPMRARNAAGPKPATIPTSNDSAHNFAGPAIRTGAIRSPFKTATPEPLCLARVTVEKFVRHPLLPPPASERENLGRTYVPKRYSR